MTLKIVSCHCYTARHIANKHKLEPVPACELDSELKYGKGKEIRS
jgi:hypothetical protein